MRHVTLLFLLLLAQAAIAQPAAPFDCQQSADHRAFDFWLGQWAVHDSKGTLQGTNQITSVQNGCAVQEQWRSVRGGTGQSINYYHPEQDRWHQLWHDAGASIIDIRGGMEAGSMTLTGTIVYLNDQRKRAFRGTWTPLPDGRVRQYFEEQDDAGVWQPWFEGFYSRSDTGARE